MSITFAELGIPFPLFEASISEASEYRGLGTCSLCGASKSHRFEVGIGDDVIVSCPACGTDNALDADDREDERCRSCGELVPFPVVSPGGLKICYECLRAGRAALSKDTELGLVTWQEAVAGVTGGSPGLHHSDFELVRIDDEEDEIGTDQQDGGQAAVDVLYGAPGPGQFVLLPSKDSDRWLAARVPSELLLELTRTPTYPTWQGEVWLFCHRRPMIYIGVWGQEEFERHAPDGDGRAFFMEVIEPADEDLWQKRLGEAIVVYVFRCSVCGRIRGHWDVD